MTALDAVSWVDGKQHNVFSLTDKLLWLSQVEAEVRALWSRCGKNVPPEDMKADTVLLIPKPYEGIYTHYLEAQMHYANQEYLKFNNAMGLFSALWQEYANTHPRAAEILLRRDGDVGSHLEAREREPGKCDLLRRLSRRCSDCRGGVCRHGELHR